MLGQQRACALVRHRPRHSSRVCLLLDPYCGAMAPTVSRSLPTLMVETVLLARVASAQARLQRVNPGQAATRLFEHDPFRKPFSTFRDLCCRSNRDGTIEPTLESSGRKLAELASIARNGSALDAACACAQTGSTNLHSRSPHSPGVCAQRRRRHQWSESRGATRRPRPVP